jgi:hypothetical protein
VETKSILKAVKRTLVYGSYVFTIVAGLVAVWALFFPNTIGEALLTLSESSEEISVSNRVIADNTAGAKREVSDDPIIQISNRGYEFNKSDFARSITNHDLKTVNLFCDAAPKNWVSDEYFPFGVDWSDDILKVIRRCDAINRSEMCSLGATDARYSMVSRAGKSKNRFVKFCGKSAATEIDDAESTLQRFKDASTFSDIDYKEHCEQAERKIHLYIRNNRPSLSQGDLSENVGFFIAKFQNINNFCDSMRNCSEWVTEHGGQRLRRCRELGIDLQASSRAALR